MRIMATDWIPRQVDAGAIATIYDVVSSGSAEMRVLAQELCNVAGVRAVSEAMAEQMVSDLLNANMLPGIGVDGTLPAATARYDAPTDLGADASAVWFGTPDSGTEHVRWYVNGQLAAREQRDLSMDRSMALATLGAVSGAVVQICIEAGGVVGWWARITIV